MKEKPNVTCANCKKDFWSDMLDVKSSTVTCTHCGKEQSEAEALIRFDAKRKSKKKSSQGKRKGDRKTQQKKLELPEPSSEAPFGMSPAVPLTSVINDDGSEVITRWIGFQDGNPFIATALRKSWAKHIFPLSGYDALGGPLLPRLKRFKGADGKEMFAYDERVLTKQNLVNELTFGNDRKSLTLLLEAIPLSNEKFREPFFYEEDGHQKFPKAKIYSTTGGAYAKILIDSLNIGEMDQHLYYEAMELLKSKPKQMSLFYGIAGANVINILHLRDLPINIQSIGYTGTGKSFTTGLCLKILYGIGEAALEGDAVNSAFRKMAVNNATDLPVYIEEAKVRDKTMFKSLAHSIRGRPDQSLKIYDNKATIVMSMNSPLPESSDPDDEEANKRREARYYFSEEDAIDEQAQIQGDKLMHKLKREPGGLLYQKLEEKTTAELENHYFKLRAMNLGTSELSSRMGAWIMDDIDFRPVISQAPTPDLLQEFFSLVVPIGTLRTAGDVDLQYDEKKIQGHMRIDIHTRTLRIDAEALNYFLKGRNKKYDMSANRFAKGYLVPLGFSYGSNYIWDSEEPRRQCATGKIPDEYLSERLLERMPEPPIIKQPNTSAPSVPEPRDVFSATPHVSKEPMIQRKPK